MKTRKITQSELAFLTGELQSGARIAFEYGNNVVSGTVIAINCENVLIAISGGNVIFTKDELAARKFVFMPDKKTFIQRIFNQ